VSKSKEPKFSLGDVSSLMPRAVKYVEAQAAFTNTAIYGREHSRERMPLPEEYDTVFDKSLLPTMLPQLLRIFQGIFGSYWRYKFRGKAKKSTASAEFLSGLETHARENGAVRIGYAEITPDLIFKDFVIPHKNAVVIISEMKKEPFITAPSDEAMTQVGKAYADTTFIANKLTSYLRKGGFSAYSGISIGGSVDHTRLAERAGLGKIGYHGSLISPEEGARVRINVVYTNIENLPYETHNEHDWILDFCAMCNKCVRKCPPGAIRQNPNPDADGRISVVTSALCGPYMAANKSCGLCIAVCPFSNAGYDKIKAGFRGTSTARPS